MNCNSTKTLPVSRHLSTIQRGVLAIAFGAFLYSCSSGSSDNNQDDLNQSTSSSTTEAEAPAADNGKGVGPVKEVTLGEGIDEQLASQGKALFDGKCSACHQLSDQKVVGPGLAGVTERRQPEWIMNMIVNPEEMTKKDPTAKKLLAEHLTQMTNQNVNERDARAMLEFFRQNDASN
ncbi:cytochrome C [Pontibacter sp. SGAir0037]|nr:cytochrome C [Pontibacter sp. SGAir0037]